MQIPSDITYIRKASREVENLLRSNNVDDSLIFDIRLSIEEAIKNAIIHGNKKNRKLPVYISYSLKDNKFNVEIEDKGSGFNPGEVQDPTSNENLLKEGGRGVFLIQKLMDEVKYNDRGNKVSMVKYIKKNKGGCDAN